MTKEQIINDIIKDQGYKSYLEIGTQYGESIGQIECDYKVGVDPYDKVKVKYAPDKFYNLTSDDFFRQNEEDFDCIFVDGLHHADQALADIVNSAAILNHGGCVVVHDLMPISELEQKVPRVSQSWTGDVWKAWYLINKGNYNVTTFTHDTDHGVGILRLGRNGLDELLCDFDDNQHRIELLTYQNDFEDYKKMVL